MAMADNPTPPGLERFLEPTPFIDADQPGVASYARDLVGSAESDAERALRIFYAVRDDVRYTPYGLSFAPDTMTASHTLETGQGFCVQKAILLAATARAVGIPSRLGFADVRNHLATKRLLEVLGTDLLIYHGYTELWLDGRWIKATPAFNLSLCEKFGVLPLDFDGVHDSVLQPFDQTGNRHMEYVRDRGTYADLPFDLLEAEYAKTYPGLFTTNHGPSGASGDFEDFEEEAEGERIEQP